MEIIKGVDISKWNNVTSWKKLKPQLDFVIIKVGGGDKGLYIDRNFETNFKNAHKIFKKVGVYWYLGSNTKSEIKKEIDFLNNELKKQARSNLFATLPVFLDVERQTQLKATNLNDTIKSGLEYIEYLGYFAGLYTFRSFYDKKFENNFNKRFYTWIADWRKSKREEYFKSDFKALQYSSTGKISGIDGYVDLDYIIDDPYYTIKYNKFNLV